MPTINATVNIDGTDYEARTARIEHTFLGYEDHGFLTAVLFLDYLDGGHQGFGTRILGTRNDTFPYEGNAPEHVRNWVDHCLIVAGVDSWEELPGKAVYALFSNDHMNGSMIAGICSMSGKSYFLPEQYSKQEDVLDS